MHIIFSGLFIFLPSFITTYMQPEKKSCYSLLLDICVNAFVGRFLLFRAFYASGVI